MKTTNGFDHALDELQIEQKRFNALVNERDRLLAGGGDVSDVVRKLDELRPSYLASLQRVEAFMLSELQGLQ